MWDNVKMKQYRMSLISFIDFVFFSHFQFVIFYPARSHINPPHVVPIHDRRRLKGNCLPVKNICLQTFSQFHIFSSL